MRLVCGVHTDTRVGVTLHWLLVDVVPCMYEVSTSTLPYAVRRRVGGYSLHRDPVLARD